ncbi:MAG: oligoendopeptidase F, partial [Clostridia bacterium]|nr:oligoendopeptidase F [Clostridia bacterium]
MSDIRNQMDPAFQWDFTHIFPSRKAWEDAYTKAEEAIACIARVEGTLGTSAESLKNGLEQLFETAEQVELVYLYASLHKNSDNGDPAYQEMEGRAVNLYVSFQTAVSFLEPELLACEEETLRTYLKAPTLAPYRHMVEDTLRGRAHMLSAEQEKMLAMLSDVAGNCSNIFEMLESVDMTFPPIRDEKGETVPLTHGSFGVYRESRDRSVRKEAFETYFGEFGRYINTFAAMYAGSVKTDSYFASVRSFSSPCEASLYGGNVPVSVYDSLCEAVHGGLPTMKRYLELRRRQLGLEEL